MTEGKPSFAGDLTSKPPTCPLAEEDAGEPTSPGGQSSRDLRGGEKTL